MSYSYGPYGGGYFAAPAGYYEPMCMRSSKEIEAHMKKQCQLEIADELSHIDTEEYGDDILNYMIEQEVMATTFLEFTADLSSSNACHASNPSIFRQKFNGTCDLICLTS